MPEPTLDPSPPPHSQDTLKMALGKRDVDEFAIRDALMEMFTSPELRTVMSDKGISDVDKAMKDLKQDIDQEGVLTKPMRWGVNFGGSAAPAEQPAQDVQKSQLEEMDFWNKMKDGKFYVPTAGKVHPVAGRWQRAIDDPEDDKEGTKGPTLRKKYFDILGKNVTKRRSDFRTRWATNMYQQVQEPWTD